MTLHPEYVVFSSYGNDSIALVQWLKNNNVKNPVWVVYSETGWAHPEWGDRVRRGEEFANKCGFFTHRISSIGLVQLARMKKAWPRQGMQFCTEELKIEPAKRWLSQVDPHKESVCAVGVRRAESRARSAWPEWTEESVKHDGRALWAPLVRHTDEERNELVRMAGFEVIPTRSMECWPCVNSNRADLRTLTSERIDEIERIESDMGMTANGKPRTVFRPYRHGGAVGIREVKRWADSDRGEYEPPTGGCDGGWCGT